MKYVVTGATGFLGRALCLRLLEQGHEVVALSRSAEKARKLLGDGVTCYSWLASASKEWKASLHGAEVVIHLAGEALASQRWTPEFKQLLTTSRVDSTRQLVLALRDSEPRPKTLISASAAGFYGNRNDETITEESPAGSGFLADLCQKWEAETQRASEYGVREVRLRIGVVIGDGGSLEKILYPLPISISPWKLGLGGRLGSGKQWLPWVHIEDVAGLCLWAAKSPEVNGAINAVSPHPVTNAEFSRALGGVLKRPTLLPVPAFALHLLLGEFADVVLDGQKVLPNVAQRLGYSFRYREIGEALASVLLPHS